MDKKRYTISDLISVMEKLRGENGCPWDKVQTHDSIKDCMVEESYEVIDAIDKKDDKMVANELGDLLLQVVFHAQIAKERNAFCFEDVVDEICNKLIVRHTHVFGEDAAANDGQALDLWDKNKKNEKNFSTVTDTLRDVPNSFPSLMRAQKVIKRAAKGEIDFFVKSRSIDEIKLDMIKCICEISDEQGEENNKNLENLLLLNAALLNKIGGNGEILLKSAVDNFIEKFEILEQVAQQK